MWIVTCDVTAMLRKTVRFKSRHFNTVTSTVILQVTAYHVQVTGGFEVVGEHSDFRFVGSTHHDYGGLLWQTYSRGSEGILGG